MYFNFEKVKKMDSKDDFTFYRLVQLILKFDHFEFNVLLDAWTDI